MTNRKRTHPGFTLIELLVVVSIISLLVAILLPALGGARRAAQAVVCASNLSQLGKGMHIYSNKYREYFPRVYGGPVPWGEKRGALYQLVVASEMIGDSADPPRLLFCPESDPPEAISYALNAVVFGYEDQDNPDTALNDVAPLQVGFVSSPAKVVAIYDVQVNSLAQVWHATMNTDEADISDQFTGTGMLGIARPNDAGFMWQESLDDPPNRARGPHTDAHNIVFVDGHVTKHARWDTARMTRLSGWEPNDSLLH